MVIDRNVHAGRLKSLKILLLNGVCIGLACVAAFHRRQSSATGRFGRTRPKSSMTVANMPQLYKRVAAAKVQPGQNPLYLTPVCTAYYVYLINWSMLTWVCNAYPIGQLHLCVFTRVHTAVCLCKRAAHSVTHCVFVYAVPIKC